MSSPKPTTSADTFVGRPDGSSNLRSVINFSLVAIGVGILALPRAIAQGGWVMGPVLLFVAWGISQYAMYLLWKCMFMAPEGGKFDSFQAIGKHCFGTFGQVFVSLVLYVDLMAVCALLVILVGDGMHEMIPSVDRVWWLVAFVLVMLPLSWMPSMKEVAFVSALGIAAAIVTVIAVVTASAREISDPTREHVHHIWPQSVDLVTLAFTNFMNAFTVAPVIPTLINDMQRPQDFPKVATMSFLLIGTIFCAIAFSGYAGFGADLLNYANLTFAIADGRPAGDWLVIVVQVAIEIVCFSHFLVMFNPVCVGLEDAIEHVKGAKVPYWVKIVSRTCLMAVCFVIAISVPGFGALVDLIGATLVMFLQIIFPIVFFLMLVKMHEKLGHKAPYSGNLSKYTQYVVMVIALIMAAIGMVIGTKSALSAW